MSFIVDAGIFLSFVGLILKLIYDSKKRNNRENGNGAMLESIKNGINEVDKQVQEHGRKLNQVDKKVVAIGTDVGNMKTNCVTTITAFTREIGINRAEILDLIKKGTHK